MVAAYGKRTALTDGFKATYTYDQMSRAVNKLASILVEKGISRGSCVGVLQSPGPDWICSLLAILRTGAAYVAFDTQVTSERLSLIAQDCKPKILFVDKATQKESAFLINADIEVINISHIDLTDEVPWVKNQAHLLDTAVIAYTSGTTGVPKGVIQTHSGYKNFLEFSVPAWGIQEGQETLLQQSSYAFDMSLGQILVSLTYGGTLVIPQRSLRNDPAAICDLLVSSNVTFTMGTPTEFIAWINHGEVP
jgi:hybrid polyketide synthase / nonribosomal peptide synthetase ACE1